MPDTNVLAFNPERRARRRTSAASRAIPTAHGAALTVCLDSWQLSLESSNKAVKTIRSYTDVAKRFIAYLDEKNLPCDAEGVRAEHVRAFLIRERHRTSDASADVCYRNLHVWFAWMCSPEVGERTGPSPVLKGDRPQVVKKAKKYLSEDEQRALLRTATSNTFEDRRDAALMRILGDSGPRATGLMNVRYTPSHPATNDVDLKGRRLRIVLKGGDEHWLPLGTRATQALDRYLRARSVHKRAQTSPWLWLGITGRGTEHMTPEGLRDMLKRRGELARIPGVTPHRYRGSAAHQLLRAGAGKEVVQRVLGWKSAEMVDHYTDDLADERAREIHARLSPGDRI